MAVSKAQFVKYANLGFVVALGISSILLAAGFAEQKSAPKQVTVTQLNVQGLPPVEEKIAPMVVDPKLPPSPQQMQKHYHDAGDKLVLSWKEHVKELTKRAEAQQAVVPKPEPEYKNYLFWVGAVLMAVLALLVTVAGFPKSNKLDEAIVQQILGAGLLVAFSIWTNNTHPWGTFWFWTVSVVLGFIGMLTQEKT